MAEAHNIESILVVDCGTVVTKLLLLERVGGSYQFVAQTETVPQAKPPWNDLSIGVVQGVQELESITGRTLYLGGRIVVPRTGRRASMRWWWFSAQSSRSRVVLAGLVQEMSLESGRRAVGGTYATIEATLIPRGEPARASGDLGPYRTRSRPQMPFCWSAVSTEAHGVPCWSLAEAVALASSMMEEERRPTVIYAGNAATQIPGDQTPWGHHPCGDNRQRPPHNRHRASWACTSPRWKHSTSRSV